MKKLPLVISSIFTIITFVSLLSFFFSVFANQSVQVSAIVGTGNHAPVVLTLNPSSDPKLLPRDAIQNYALYFRDDEKDVITYTITPATNGGYSNPISGTINALDYDTASGAYINFVYLAPPAVPGTNPTTLTVIINDTHTLVRKDIHLHIY